jgi:hypothetical protein
MSHDLLSTAVGADILDHPAADPDRLEAVELPNEERARLTRRLNDAVRQCACELPQSCWLDHGCQHCANPASASTKRVDRCLQHRLVRGCDAGAGHWCSWQCPKMNSHCIPCLQRRKHRTLSCEIVENRSLARKIAGLVAGVRYNVKPTISEALFSYRRTA